MQRIFLNVGYELTEKQLRAHLVQFGVLSDLYLPKHSNGRNKGYGFATFASAKSLALALQQPKHVIDGITVQVSRAGVRPPDLSKDVKPPAAAKTQQAPPFGRGPRLYVGGVPDFVSAERVREHFCQWGFVSDVYFPSNKGQKRMNYCFVSFQSQQNAERACNESPRNLDGWPLESISLAEDRKQGSSQSEGTSASAATRQRPCFTPDLDLDPTSLDAESLPGYVAQLQRRYQQHLAAAMASAAAIPESKSLAKLQHTPQIPGFAKTPDFMMSPLEDRSSYTQGSFSSPSTHQQWADSFLHQPMSQLSGTHEIVPHAAGIPGLPSFPPSLVPSRGSSGPPGSITPEYSADNLSLLMQQSMVNAAADQLHNSAGASDFSHAMNSAFEGKSAEGLPLHHFAYFNDGSGLPYFP